MKTTGARKMTTQSLCEAPDAKETAQHSSGATTRPVKDPGTSQLSIRVGMGPVSTVIKARVWVVALIEVNSRAGDLERTLTMMRMIIPAKSQV
jgi:hypothetical protein